MSPPRQQCLFSSASAAASCSCCLLLCWSAEALLERTSHISSAFPSPPCLSLALSPFLPWRPSQPPPPSPLRSDLSYNLISGIGNTSLGMLNRLTYL